MKYFLVTFKNFVRRNANLGDRDSQIVPVMATVIRYENGDLLFYDNDGLIRGVANGEWVSFVETDQDDFALVMGGAV